MSLDAACAAADARRRAERLQPGRGTSAASAGGRRRGREERRQRRAAAARWGPTEAGKKVRPRGSDGQRGL